MATTSTPSAMIPIVSVTSATGMNTNGGKKLTVILVVGMAGSGKTTAMHRFAAHLHAAKKKTYIINLDPAVLTLPYSPNIDIRDTVKYKEVMKVYNLGPNGAILTSLNLFTTKFEQLLAVLDRRASELDYVLIDTPGQIEVFTWSASGSIITDTLAASFPTIVAYIIDTPRTTAPSTFMSNMLYACSILYKTRVPFVAVFNKIDVVGCEFAMDWMSDFEKFQEALRGSSSTSGEYNADYGDGGESYMTSLVQSMSLVLDEFYSVLSRVGISAVTGTGVHELFMAIDAAREEYINDYRPELERRMQQKIQRENERRKEQTEKMVHDLQLNGDSDDEHQNSGNGGKYQNQDDDENTDEGDDKHEYEQIVHGLHQNMGAVEESSFLRMLDSSGKLFSLWFLRQKNNLKDKEVLLN